MTWRLVARQGVREAWRSWELRGTMIAFSLIFAMVGYFVGPVALGPSNDPGNLFGFMTGIIVVLVPATALALAHDDVAGRREDGRLRLVLGQPVSRRAIVVGQYVSTSVTIVASVVVAVCVGILVATARGGALPPAELTTAILGVGVVIGLTYLGIGVTISTWLKTTDFTGALAFGAFIIFTFAWTGVPRAVLWILDQFVAVKSNPDWLVYVDTLSPVMATGRLMAPGVALGNLPQTGDTAVYLFSFVVIAWWIVVLPALAIRHFETTDL